MGQPVKAGGSPISAKAGVDFPRFRGVVRDGDAGSVPPGAFWNAENARFREDGLAIVNRHGQGKLLATAFGGQMINGIYDSACGGYGGVAGFGRAPGIGGGVGDGGVCSGETGGSAKLYYGFGGFDPVAWPFYVHDDEIPPESGQLENEFVHKMPAPTSDIVGLWTVPLLVAEELI